jgi:phospholipid-binding lipoprotein MlaA
MNRISTVVRGTKLDLILYVSLLSGCATNATYDDPHDPFEGFNRAVYQFNDAADRYVMEPIARGYDRVVPTPINNSITNFFNNIQDLIIGANNVFQGKVQDGLSDLARFLANTTVGLGGLFDVATSGGLVKHNEDFGQTLGVWGFDTGPYLVLPFLGPSNVRDGLALGVDGAAWPLFHVGDTPLRIGAGGLRTVDTRADLLKVTDLLKEAALDPYIYTREAYLQRRLFLVYDGNIPKEKMEEFEFEDNDFEFEEEAIEGEEPLPPPP